MWNSVKNKTKALVSHGVQRIHAGFVASVYTLAFTAFVLRAPWLHYHLTPQPLWRKIRPQKETVPRQRRFFGLFFSLAVALQLFVPFKQVLAMVRRWGCEGLEGNMLKLCNEDEGNVYNFANGTRFTQLPG